MSREENPGMEQPLLEELGHHELLSMITQEEVHTAQKLLTPFLKEYSRAGVEKVAILAYLFGVKQGYHEMFGENARRNLASHLLDVSYAGKVYGFMEAVLLFGKVEISPQILQHFDFRPPDGHE